MIKFLGLCEILARSSVMEAATRMSILVGNGQVSTYAINTSFHYAELTWISTTGNLKTRTFDRESLHIHWILLISNIAFVHSTVSFWEENNIINAIALMAHLPTKAKVRQHSMIFISVHIFSVSYDDNVLLLLPAYITSCRYISYSVGNLMSDL